MIIDCIEMWVAQQSTPAEAHSGTITAQVRLVEGPVHQLEPLSISGVPERGDNA